MIIALLIPVRMLVFMYFYALTVFSSSNFSLNLSIKVLGCPNDLTVLMLQTESLMREPKNF